MHLHLFVPRSSVQGGLRKSEYRPMRLESQVMPLKTGSLKIFAICAFILAATYLFYPQIKQLGQYAANFSSPSVTAPAEKKDTEFEKAAIFKQTIQYLTKNYYDTESLVPRTLLQEALLGISRNVAEIVVEFPETGNRFFLELSGQREKFSFKNLQHPEDIVPAIQEVFAFIAEHYQGEVKFDEIEYAAANGMLKSLDPHSGLLPPKIFTEFKTQTEGEFGGIGIVIGLKEGELTVIAPLPDTPAARAGLRAKDRIVKIGEEASINMDLTEAVERLRGKVGTKVDITVEREGAPGPISVSLVRDKIKIQSVQAKLSSGPEGDIGILKVKSFQEETLPEIRRHLQSMRDKSKNFRGLILDLRNNPGGLLNQAIDIADMFLTSGTIVLTVGAHDQILEINRAQGSDGDENYPLLVLVNDGSASASEIVAGAIKQNNRGIVMGQQTFGKGSVQSVYALRDGSALKLTVAQYLTPGKTSIQSVGITPDIKLIPKGLDEKKIDILESETFGEKDLEKHLESALVKSDPPTYTVGYYQPSKSEEDEEENTFMEDINEEEDFALKLAKKILLGIQTNERTTMLADIKGIVENTNSEELISVARAIEKIGIDWSLDSVSSGKPKAEVTVNLQSSGGQSLKAGEEVPVELRVKNTGDAPFHRLIAVTESEHFLLKNREFIFGKINPGETKSWKVPIKVPSGSFRREDTVTFAFQEGNNLVPENFKTVLQTEPLKRPIYGYQIQMFDNGTLGSKGDGDQWVEAGETIALQIQVKNHGEGKSQKTMVNLKNLEGQGVFLNKGREKLNELNPTEAKEALLIFSVDPKFSKNKAELEISIIDEESQEFLKDKIKFSIGKDSSLARRDAYESGPQLILENQPFPTKTKQKKISISGKVHDDTGLKDVSVFVGDYKAFLKTFQGDQDQGKIQESAFAAAVPLKEKENNLITILARDQKDLVTRESFYIYQE